MNFTRYQKFAEKLAKEAGTILVKYREKAKIEKRKSDLLDIATDADLASEKFLTTQIHKKFPGHNILAEERGDELRRSDFCWVIDPLDGTKEFVRGIPHYNVSIALEYKGEVVVGIVFRPPTNEFFSTAKGKGAFSNGQQIFVSKESDLKNSFIWTHFPKYKSSDKELKLTWSFLKQIVHECYRLREFAEDVTTLCWLARGALEGWVLTCSSPQWWDVAPGILMVEEAGGKVTNMKGEKIKNRDLSKGIVASNGKIHEELLKYLQV